jgi:hypothetical protein
MLYHPFADKRGKPRSSIWLDVQRLFMNVCFSLSSDNIRLLQASDFCVTDFEYHNSLSSYFCTAMLRFISCFAFIHLKYQVEFNQIDTVSGYHLSDPVSVECSMSLILFWW